MFKKKAGIKRDIRSRNIDDDDNGTLQSANKMSIESSNGTSNTTNTDTESGSAVVLKRRKVQTSNPLVQGSGISREIGSSRKHGGVADGDDEFDESDDDDRAKIKRDGTSKTAASRDDATRTNTWYDDVSEKGNEKAKSDTNNNDDGIYRGKAAYNNFTNPSSTDSSNKPKGMAKGPVRANNNVRTITMVDYQPSVCKPYKETGMCGYGDSCIYLHDRSDYLAGWQLDKLPNNTFSKRGDLLEKAKDEGAEEDLPFACLICRKKFTDPVVTKCGHYFCMSCAIKRYEKTSKCFACNRQTQGIFNSATKILDRMASIRSALQEERETKDWDEKNDDIQQTSGELLEGVEIGNL
jgi:RING finger protein 113A